MKLDDDDGWKLHDRLAHQHDRERVDGWPTCSRCIERTVAFHDEHRIGHLIPSRLRDHIDQLHTGTGDPAA